MWLTATYRLKPCYYNRILLLAEMEADDVLLAAFVTNRCSFKSLLEGCWGIKHSP